MDTGAKSHTRVYIYNHFPALGLVFFPGGLDYQALAYFETVIIFFPGALPVFIPNLINKDFTLNIKVLFDRLQAALQFFHNFSFFHKISFNEHKLVIEKVRRNQIGVPFLLVFIFPGRLRVLYNYSTGTEPVEDSSYCFNTNSFGQNSDLFPFHSTTPSIP